MTAGGASVQELELLHAWWRAANYLSVGQTYEGGEPDVVLGCAGNHDNLHVRGYKEEGTREFGDDMPDIRDWHWAT